MHTPETLIAFRDRVAEAFRAKRIRAPVHFPGGNEAQVIKAFEDVRPGDWVCSNWRSMYHALLKGWPPDDLFAEILAGRSMYLHSKAHRFLASSIVGGMLPTAVGLALGINRRIGPERVHVFVGDMTATTGLFHEAVEYATGHGLPMRFVIEDNGLSTNAVTEATWGDVNQGPPMQGYYYDRTMPHVGLLERVSF